jgi:hypothetical protein
MKTLTRTEFTKKEAPAIDWYVKQQEAKGVAVSEVFISSVWHSYRHTYSDWVIVKGKQVIDGNTYAFTEGCGLKDLLKSFKTV